jgi:3-phosphoshikimate 1-carboxyvinyltransferase
MTLSLSHLSKKIKGEIQLTSSKSESNRALIIKTLCSDDFKIDNLSDSDDTKTLDLLLKSDEKVVDVYHAGTAMRFLTAYCCLQNGERILTGSERMKQRPIKILVNALRELGAEIEYLENDGFPPLKIIGAQLKGGKIVIDGSISSQYISALLMIAPKLTGGLELIFKGELTSKPYADMTINIMQHFGINVKWVDGSIVVAEGNYLPKNFKIEADWSAASYWYSIVALAQDAEIKLYGLKPKSLQGDSAVIDIYKNFGVKTEFIENGVCLTKVLNFQLSTFNFQLNFTNCPDIAQTVAVTCAALNVKAKLTGLKTLRIKETDRILALQTELNNLGFNVEVDNDDLIVNRHSCESRNLPSWSRNSIKTYDDHRMAMSFTPLALIAPITIENPEVVKKSYPNFWEDIESVGF